jgi:hypothetical protein
MLNSAPSNSAPSNSAPSESTNYTLGTESGTDLQNIKDAINATVIAPVLNLGLAGLKFSIRKNETINFSSDITEHYLENNTPVAQHITNKPISITLTGELHELVILTQTDSSTGILQNVTEKLTTISALAPQISQTDQNIRNAIEISTMPIEFGSSGQQSSLITSSATQAATNLYSLYKNLLSLGTTQGKITQFIKSLWQAKIGLGIDTRLGYYDKMYIESVRISARDNTRQISDIEITLKELRFASIDMVVFDNTAYQGRVNAQKQEEQPVGKVNTPPTSRGIFNILIKDNWTKFKNALS